MKRDDIIRMAREAGFTMDYPATERWIEMQTHFADLVSAAEREACAKVAEDERIIDPCKGDEESHNSAIINCASAIRSEFYYENNP